VFASEVLTRFLLKEFQLLAYSLVQLVSLKTAYKPLKMSF
jgi:hypothetical protein